MARTADVTVLVVGLASKDEGEVQMMDFVFKTRNCVSKTRNFVLK